VFVAKKASPAVFETCSKHRGHKFDLSKSRDVICHVTIGFPIGHFLLMVLWDQGCTLTDIFNCKMTKWLTWP